MIGEIYIDTIEETGWTKTIEIDYRRLATIEPMRKIFQQHKDDGSPCNINDVEYDVLEVNNPRQRVLEDKTIRSDRMERYHITVPIENLRVKLGKR